MLLVDYGMRIGYQMCRRAKKRARKLADGTIEDQYNLLETYATVIKKANDNTSVWIEGDMEGESRRFKRMYICYGALKKGWREGCKPIIGLDGCHLKTVCKGIMLTAVGSMAIMECIQLPGLLLRRKTEKHGHGSWSS